MAAERDREIGKALAAMRGATSQAALAEQMRDRGWKWSQATVWSVEQGERPVRLAEAVDLAAVLDGRVEDLLQAASVGAERGDRVRLVRVLVAEIKSALLEAARSGAFVLGYQQQLAEQLDGLTVGDIDADLLSEAEAVLKHRLDDVPEAAQRLREKGRTRGEHREEA